MGSELNRCLLLYWLSRLRFTEPYFMNSIITDKISMKMKEYVFVIIITYYYLLIQIYAVRHLVI